MELFRVLVVTLFIMNIIFYLRIQKKQKRLECKSTTSIIKSNTINMQERYMKLKKEGAFDHNLAFCTEFENFMSICIELDDYSNVKFSRKSLLNKENLYRQIRSIKTEESLTNKEEKELFHDYKEMRMLLLDSYFPRKVKYYHICTLLELLMITCVLLCKHKKRDKKVETFKNPDSYITLNMRTKKSPLTC